MNDLISRKAVMEELLAIQDVTYMSTCLTVDECKGKQWMIARAIDAVKDAPTIDAEPVRHGRWENGFCSICRELNPTCQLNESTLEYEEVYLDYCPNCGAKMDEVDT